MASRRDVFVDVETLSVPVTKTSAADVLTDDLPRTDTEPATELAEVAEKLLDAPEARDESNSVTTPTRSKLTMPTSFPASTLTSAAVS